MTPIPAASHEWLRLHPAPWELRSAPLLSKSRDRLRSHFSLLPALPRQERPHHRPDDTGCPLRKQNIIEGSKAAGISKETEIKLTGVARASLEELLADYRDFLRVRDLRIWPKDSREAQYVRKLGNRSHVTYATYRTFVETRPAEVVANIALCLIHQVNYLLDQQIRRLEQDFLKEGGLRERMTRARLQYRDSSAPP